MTEPKIKTIDTVTNAVDVLRRHIRVQYKSQRNAGRILGLSNVYLSEVSRGDKPPSQKLLDLIGLEKRVVYVVKGE